MTTPATAETKWLDEAARDFLEFYYPFIDMSKDKDQDQ
jgi:hypothetical protein